MRNAHFQIARNGPSWVVRLGGRDYPYPTRSRAILAAARAATRISALGAEAILFLEPEPGRSLWQEWRPGQRLPRRIAAPRLKRPRSRAEGACPVAG